MTWLSVLILASKYTLCKLKLHVGTDFIKIVATTHDTISRDSLQNVSSKLAEICVQIKSIAWASTIRHSTTFSWQQLRHFSESVDTLFAIVSVRLVQFLKGVDGSKFTSNAS